MHVLLLVEEVGQFVLGGLGVELAYSFGYTTVVFGFNSDLAVVIIPAVSLHAKVQLFKQLVAFLCFHINYILLKPRHPTILLSHNFLRLRKEPRRKLLPQPHVNFTLSPSHAYSTPSLAEELIIITLIKINSNRWKRL